MKPTKIMFAATALLSVPTVASAIGWKSDGYALDVSGYGTAGMVQVQDLKPDFIGDWRIRTQATRDITSSDRVGLTYSIDAKTVDADEYIDDLFAFFQSRDYGRVEIGMTDSAAQKLGLGLPDVGGMRVNSYPLFYKKIYPDGNVISLNTVDSGDQSLRINLVSNYIGGAQYGVSFATLANGFDYAVDAGVKIRHPSGKVKTALSFGASFIDNPDNFASDAYATHLTADWRGQFATGMNIQYNSWVWGINARAVYDDDAISPASDGVSAGTGVSYDLLNYSLSLSYIVSTVGIWHDDDRRYTSNTILGSFRYKYSANVDGWTSVGVSSHSPFVSAGLRLTF